MDDNVPSGRRGQRVRRQEPSLLQVEPVYVGAVAAKVGLAGVPEVDEVPAALGYPQPVESSSVKFAGFWFRFQTDFEKNLSKSQFQIQSRLMSNSTDEPIPVVVAVLRVQGDVAVAVEEEELGVVVGEVLEGDGLGVEAALELHAQVAHVVALHPRLVSAEGNDVPLVPGDKVARWHNLIPSFPWIAPGLRVWGALSKEGIELCSLA